MCKHNIYIYIYIYMYIYIYIYTYYTYAQKLRRQTSKSWLVKFPTWTMRDAPGASDRKLNNEIKHVYIYIYI